MNTEENINTMTPQEILNIIQSNSLTVRCLPYVNVSYLTYREGDENRKYVDANGKETKDIRTVVEQKFDLEYFKNTPPSEWSKNQTPEQRLQTYLKNNPSGIRKILRVEKTVLNGGWWYVKETINTDSTVVFNRKYDKFFAPTLEEAIKLYLGRE